MINPILGVLLAARRGCRRALLSFDRIGPELATLNRMIDLEKDPIEKRELCAAYRALNWARSPDAFAPPSEGI